MRVNAMKAMIELATRTKGGFANAVAASIEQDVVVPSILEKNLKAAGLSLFHRNSDQSSRVQVIVVAGKADSFEDADNSPDDGRNKILARGASHDRADALLQGVFAALREEAPEMWAGIIARDARANVPIGQVAPAQGMTKL